MISVQPYFVFSTHAYYKNIIRRNNIAHYYKYLYDCTDLTKSMIAIPDGSIDLLIERDGDNFIAGVYGSVLKSTEIDNKPQHQFIGMRFFPGIVPYNLDVSMSELIEDRIDLSLIIKNKDIVKKMEEETNWKECLNIYTRDYNKYYYDNKYNQNSLVENIKSLIINRRGLITVEEISKYFVYSERYINMIFKNSIGINPKTFSEIIKFQNALQIINNNRKDKLIDIGLQAGYFDQSHFIKSFKKYTSTTPKKYKNLLQEVNYFNRLHSEKTMII